MSRSTISTFRLFEMFPNEETARQYLESRLWPNGVLCPECRNGERITVRQGGYYRCNACKLDFKTWDAWRLSQGESEAPAHRLPENYGLLP